MRTIIFVLGILMSGVLYGQTYKFDYSIFNRITKNGESINCDRDTLIVKQNKKKRILIMESSAGIDTIRYREARKFTDDKYGTKSEGYVADNGMIIGLTKNAKTNTIISMFLWVIRTDDEEFILSFYVDKPDECNYEED